MDIKLTVTALDRPTFVITQDRLFEQDLTIGYSSGDFTYGIFSAGNFHFVLENYDLSLSRDDFAGARIKLEYGNQNMGWFNVDRIKEADDGHEIEVQCFDDITKFDCPFTADESDFPMAFENALAHCMYLSGLATAPFDLSSLAVTTRNEVRKISIQKIFTENMMNYTCRDIVSAIAELSCCQATLDRDGKLLLNNPFSGSSFEQDLSDRIDLDYDRDTKPISKIKVTLTPNDGTSETFEYGTDTGHTLTFNNTVFDGALQRDDIISTVQTAHNQLNGRAVSYLSATHEIIGEEVKYYRVGDRYLADITTSEPPRKHLDGMITQITYSGNFEFSYLCPGFSQEGNGTSSSGYVSGSMYSKVLSPVNQELKRQHTQLSNMVLDAKAELNSAIDQLDGNIGVVKQQIGEVAHDIEELTVDYGEIFAEVWDTEQGIRSRLEKAETDIDVNAQGLTSKVSQREYNEYTDTTGNTIAQIQDDVLIVQQTANNLTVTVSSHNGQIEGLHTGLTNAQSQIAVQANQISQKVSSSALQPNLLKNTSFLDGLKDWIVNGSSSMVYVAGDWSWRNGIKALGLNVTGQTTNTYIGLRQQITPTQGATYTFSCEYYAPSASAFDSAILVGIRGRNSAGEFVPLSGEAEFNSYPAAYGTWVKYTQTGTVNNANIVYLEAGMRTNKNGNVYYREPMLVMSDTAPAVYSPSLPAMESSIIQQAGLIAQTVTQGEFNTYKTQTATSISQKVSANGVISAINQSSESITIQASKIKLEGYTSINNRTIITTDGNLITNNMTANNGTFTGTITATAGKVANFDIANSLLRSVATLSGTTYEVRMSSTIDNLSSNISFGILATTGGVTSYPWFVRPNGYMQATNANITGTINATHITASSGVIASWTLSGNNLSRGSGSSYMGLGWTGGHRMLVGGETYAAANFAIGLSGNIKATAGKIANWDISTTSLSSTTTTGGTEYNVAISGWQGVLTHGAFHVRSRVGSGSWSYPVLIRWNGEANFTNINATGTITANSGSFRGEIISNSGRIAGWDITSSAFSSTSGTISSGATNGQRITISGGKLEFFSGGSSAGAIIASGGGIGITPASGSDISIGGDLNSTLRLYGSTITANRTITVTSDKRLKHNIKAVTQKHIDLLHLLEPKTFIYNGSDTVTVGLIAQEVEQVQIKAGLTDDEIKLVNTDKDGYKSLDYTQIISLLIGKVQDLGNQINVLKGVQL